MKGSLSDTTSKSWVNMNNLFVLRDRVTSFITIEGYREKF